MQKKNVVPLHRDAKETEMHRIFASKSSGKFFLVHGKMPRHPAAENENQGIGFKESEIFFTPLKLMKKEYLKPASTIVAVAPVSKAPLIRHGKKNNPSTG